MGWLTILCSIDDRFGLHEGVGLRVNKKRYCLCVGMEEEGRERGREGGEDGGRREGGGGGGRIEGGRERWREKGKGFQTAKPR